MNQYGIENVWNQGDFVTKAIAITLLIMSILSWTVIIIKSLKIIKLNLIIENVKQKFWHVEDFDSGIALLKDKSLPDDSNPFLQLAIAAQEATEHHSKCHMQLHEKIDASEWVTRCLKDSMDESLIRIQSGLTILASIGSTAPFVGLFGTVWGIYHALLAISGSGQASLDQVAGPVGESLIMTAFGLFVAIPAVLGYNTLVRSNKTIISNLRRFAHTLHAYFVTGANVKKNQQQEPKIKHINVA